MVLLGVELVLEVVDEAALVLEVELEVAVFPVLDSGLELVLVALEVELVVFLAGVVFFAGGVDLDDEPPTFDVELIWVRLLPLVSQALCVRGFATR